MFFHEKTFKKPKRLVGSKNCLYLCTEKVTNNPKNSSKNPKKQAKNNL